MLNHLSMAYLLSNNCTKNYWNRTTIVKIIVGGLYRRFLDNHFPGQTFPGQTFPGQDVSRTSRFPDKTFPGQSLSWTDVFRTDVSRTSDTKEFSVHSVCKYQLCRLSHTICRYTERLYRCVLVGLQ